MVKETRITFEPCDVRALLVKCQHEGCGGELRLPLEKQQVIPNQCPYCHNPLKGANEHSDTERLHSLLQKLSSSGRNAFHGIRLEFEGEPEK